MFGIYVCARSYMHLHTNTHSFTHCLSLTFASYIRVHAPVCTNIHAHPYIHMRAHMCTRTHTHIHTHTHTHTYIQHTHTTHTHHAHPHNVRTPTCARTHTHSTHTHTHTLTHAYTHTHTHTHRHTHKHAKSTSSVFLFCFCFCFCFFRQIFRKLAMIVTTLENCPHHFTEVTYQKMWLKLTIRYVFALSTCQLLSLLQDGQAEAHKLTQVLIL